MSVFKTQTLLDLILDTNIDITSATVTRIYYEKPDGSVGFWAGTVEDTTKIKYAIQTDNIDTAGTWRFQTQVVIGGRTGWGDIVQVEVKEFLEEL